MKNIKQDLITVGFISLGCPKNIVDSEKMLAIIGQAGFALSGDVENADIVVINTCGFIEPAKREAGKEILRALRWKKTGKVKKVVVAGCLAQRMGKAMPQEFKGLDAVVGLEDRDRIGKILRGLFKGQTGQSFLSTPAVPQHIQNDSGRLLITPRHSPYLRISDGCNRQCSFCTIPAIRGKFRSKPMHQILAEAEELVDNGAVEISLIAQDSSSYGKDTGTEGGLAALLNELVKIDGLRWIRPMYLYPSAIDDALIETIAANPKIVKYIDMPVQHINDRILTAMRRTHSRDETVKLIEKLRESINGLVLRTTIIAGFPGETDSEFAELLEFIEWGQFDALGCFAFWPEQGTAAARFADQLPAEVKNRRVEQLMLAQQRIVFEKNRSLVGRRLQVLVDKVEKSGPAVGRYYGQAPDIDGVCLIENYNGRAGEFIDVEVAGSKDYDLYVKV